MPLLNICGITGNNMVIQIAVVFLSSEKEADYKWAIQQLQEVMANNTIQQPSAIVTDRELALIRCLAAQFPQAYRILCRWHVNMNVLAKTKRFFPGPIRHDNGRIARHPAFQEFLSAWNTLLVSPTEDDYERQLCEMRAKFPAQAMSYCENTWLIWKENLVSCWINQFNHFGVIVTSPIEGCHATMKKYLQRGHHDLRGVFIKLEMFWTAQQDNIISTLAQQQIRPKHHINIPLFAEIVELVHGFALEKILKERAKLPRRGGPPPGCTCSIQQSMGLPCYHIIWERISNGRGAILPTDIHPHWFFERPDSTVYNPSIPSRSLTLLNPLPVQGRGRPRGALGLGRVAPTTTRREPSAFEAPSSSAPSTISRSSAPSQQVYIVPPAPILTDSGLSRLDNGHRDLYEPGTQGERAYMRALASIYQGESSTDPTIAVARVLECSDQDINSV
jgi:hypothetical protein